jgi:hypothetical protein
MAVRRHHTAFENVTCRLPECAQDTIAAAGALVAVLLIMEASTGLARIVNVDHSLGRAWTVGDRLGITHKGPAI